MTMQPKPLVNSHSPQGLNQQQSSAADVRCVWAEMTPNSGWQDTGRQGDGRCRMRNRPQTINFKTMPGKPGRNEACPCGSGVKFKRCCGRTQDSENRYDVMKRIAYVSDIGRKREAFCAAMERRMQTYHQEALACLEDQAQSLGRHLICGKGCSYCCSQYIWTSLQEAEAIVHYLYRHPEALDVFVSHYQTWKTWPGRREADQRVGLTFVNLGENLPFEEALKACHGLENPCPFLKGNACSIYPVRPYACGSIGSISPASYCRGSSPDGPVYVYYQMSLSDRPPYLGQHELHLVGGMPQMVNRLLTGGYIYLLDVLDDEELRKEVWSEPVLRSALSNYATPHA